MSTRHSWSIILLASAILLACAIGLQSNSSAQAAVPQAGITIPYAGRLSDVSGLPVSDGVYDFTFALYDTASGGTPAWSETQSGVAVQAGSFSAQLGGAALLPASAKDGQKWLAVSVRGPGEAGFTALEPRQSLGTLLALAPASPAAPAAGPSCAHDHLGQRWGNLGSYSSVINPGLYIENAGGTSLEVQSTSANFTDAAIEAMNNGIGPGLIAGSNGNLALSATSNAINGRGTALDATGTFALKARGVIKTDKNFTVYLSPHDMIARSSAGMTLTPTGSGAMVIRNDSETGEKYVSLPASTFGMLFGAPLYVASVEVCYQVTTPASGKINATGVFKNDWETGWATYLNDPTQRVSTSLQCYTVTSSLPRVVINNSTWAQLNLWFGGTGAASDITIYSVKLTLSELEDPNAGW